MSAKLLATLLVASAMFAAIAASAAEGTADRKHPVAFVKDSVITTRIKAKLAAEKVSSLARIPLDTNANDMVVLSGSARTQDAEAETIARGVEGVVSVQNIKVKKDD